MLAFILVNSESAQSECVLERIGEVEGIEKAYRIFRAYDIIAEIKTESIAELGGIVMNIQSLKHVLSTTTLMVMK